MFINQEIFIAVNRKINTINQGNGFHQLALAEHQEFKKLHGCLLLHLSHTYATCCSYIFLVSLCIPRLKE